LGITTSEGSKCQAHVRVDSAPRSADRVLNDAHRPPCASFTAARSWRVICIVWTIEFPDAAMAKLARLVAFLLFIGSVGISIALMLHGSEWSEARASMMQDIRSAMTGVAFILFCIFVFTGKKRRRPRRYHPET
jgi:hypothetical protein